MFPDGLANSSGHVGKNYTRHMATGLTAIMPHPVHFYRGARQAGIIFDEHLHNPERGFAGGFLFETSAGPPSSPWFLTPEMWGANAAPSLVFRQNLLWGRLYHGTEVTFIIPPVTEWGISPGTTETFCHSIFNPLKKPVREHVLEIEIPEGFRMLDNNASQRNRGQWKPDTQTVKRVIVDGLSCLRYRMVTDIAHLEENVFLRLFIPIKHETYAFPGGNPAVFRFRRILDGNSVDLDNVIPVKPLPPVRGGKMKNIEFSQYHMGMGSKFTEERRKARMFSTCSSSLFAIAAGSKVVENRNRPRLTV